ncbi:MAG: alpha/beta hydrolase [bacterium]|nr:alpha/beta hydrolase [bacterium]
MWYSSGTVAFLQSLGYSVGGTYDSNLSLATQLVGSNGVSVSPAGAMNDSGDIWLLNFDVGSNLSNCEAIYKQSQALALVISDVLARTGRQRVVLVGHSMGGLAMAGYLVGDPNGDGQPDMYANNVAKFVTMGTPYGGSPLAAIAAFFPLSVWQSAAIRDMIKDSSNVFLFGGYETDLGDEPSDVNCDGDPTTPARIRGLREVSSQEYPNDVEYFSIVGLWNELATGGDGVVGEEDQKLGHGEELTIRAAHHWLINLSNCLEPEAHDALAEALDESDGAVAAYAIAYDYEYLGMLTAQGENIALRYLDYDYYYITSPGPGSAIVSIRNPPVRTYVSVLDAATGLQIAAADGANDFEFAFPVHELDRRYNIAISGVVTGSDQDHPCTSALETARSPYTLSVQFPPAIFDVTVAEQGVPDGGIVNQYTSPSNEIVAAARDNDDVSRLRSGSTAPWRHRMDRSRQSRTSISTTRGTHRM